MSSTQVTFKPNLEGLQKLRNAAGDAFEDTINECTEHAKDLAFFGKYSTGETKQGIANDIRDIPRGFRAKIFTQSGHGGYVEVGGHPKHKMHAEPFLYPAFIRTIYNFFPKLRERLSG